MKYIYSQIHHRKDRNIQKYISKIYNPQMKCFDNPIFTALRFLSVSYAWLRKSVACSSLLCIYIFQFVNNFMKRKINIVNISKCCQNFSKRIIIVCNITDITRLAVTWTDWLLLQGSTVVVWLYGRKLLVYFPLFYFLNTKS